MKIPVSTCSAVPAAMALWLLVGCGKPPAKIFEGRDGPQTTETDGRGFDPLELPRDREVVPARYPRAGSIGGKQVIIEADSADDSAGLGLEMIAPEPEIDSLNSQAYRVQLSTSRVYGDARRAARVAEEIFDQPVYVDYEVPNYKVRVGSFSARDAAESYQQKAKAAGYGNAWVVMVNIGVRGIAPLYDDLTEPFLTPLDMPEDSVATDGEGGSDSED